MAARTQTIDKDHGWKRIAKDINQVGKGRGVRVGIQSDEGNTSDDGTPVVEYAFYNEFGSEDGKRPPERSFIRSTADEQRAKWNRFKAVLLGKILDGHLTFSAGLALLGSLAQKDIQEKITTLSQPPNAPRTIKEKGSSNPLIDEGTLRRSIRYKVED